MFGRGGGLGHVSILLSFGQGAWDGLHHVWDGHIGKVRDTDSLLTPLRTINEECWSKEDLHGKCGYVRHVQHDAGHHSSGQE